MAHLPKVLGVVGGGQMGAGIAQVAATAGLAVHLIDRSEAQLVRAKDGILDSLRRLAAKGKLGEEQVEATLGRITPSMEMEVGTGVRMSFWCASALTLAISTLWLFQSSPGSIQVPLLP